MFLDMDAVNHQRLNKQDFTIKKLSRVSQNAMISLVWTQIKEITKSFTLKNAYALGNNDGCVM